MNYKTIFTGLALISLFFISQASAQTFSPYAVDTNMIQSNNVAINNTAAVKCHNKDYAIINKPDLYNHTSKLDIYNNNAGPSFGALDDAVTNASALNCHDRDHEIVTPLDFSNNTTPSFGALSVEGYIFNYFMLPTEIQSQLPLGSIVRIDIQYLKMDQPDFELDGIYLYNNTVKSTISVRHTLHSTPFLTWTSFDSGDITMSDGNPSIPNDRDRVFMGSSAIMFDGQVLADDFFPTATTLSLTDSSATALQSEDIPRRGIINMFSFDRKFMYVNFQNTEGTSAGTIDIIPFRLSWKTR